MNRTLIGGWLLLFSSAVLGSEGLTDEPDGQSYNFVTHYSVEIHAPAKAVWNNLIDLGSWMYDFEMEPVSGKDNLEGQVLRLYEKSDFQVQITKAIPDKPLVIANLPAVMEGEQLAGGVSVTTLTEHAGTTTVDITMSRRYVWSNPGENHLKKRRQSSVFTDATRATWERFLARLAELSVR